MINLSLKLTFLFLHMSAYTRKLWESNCKPTFFLNSHKHTVLHNTRYFFKCVISFYWCFWVVMEKFTHFCTIPWRPHTLPFLLWWTYWVFLHSHRSLFCMPKLNGALKNGRSINLKVLLFSSWILIGLAYMLIIVRGKLWFYKGYYSF